MPSRSRVRKAKQDLREGKSPSTAAGEFVHEEIEHVREGKHGARSAQQAIAIGLNKARRAGVPLPPTRRGRTSKKSRNSAERSYRRGRLIARKRSAERSRASEHALKREARRTTSRGALSRHARRAARRRSSRR